MTTPSQPQRTDFLSEIIDADLASQVHTRVATRFPPEPNGYLHIGHAKSICLNFELANHYRDQVPATCNLRFDDTNPTKEDVEYVDSIEADVRWLGFEPSSVRFASDSFQHMYDLAESLVERGLAYVCDLSDDEIRATRGSLSEPGTPSPFRDRSPAENLDLLRRMKAGEFADGAKVLRAKIDMAAANMKLRDPLLYRIRHATHHRTGDAWCIYPMYDYAHPLEDEVEGITHSICTLEFENNRDLYNWVLANTRPSRPGMGPRQYEFARLALEYTIMSKRKLLTLVEGGHVSGWDDPRMPTLAGMRRRGYRPEAIRKFCELIGISKHNSTVDIGKLEHCVRDDLNPVARRVMAVLRPVPLVITNFADLPLASDATLNVAWLPSELGDEGSRPVPIDEVLLVDRDDVWDNPSMPAPADFQRLAVGRTVRLRHAFAVTCTELVHADDGELLEIRATAHPETLGGGKLSSGDKISGVLHWVSRRRGVPMQARLYDRLFDSPRPDEGGADFLARMSPTSLVSVDDAVIEPAAANCAPGTRFQFERVGYFIADALLHQGESVPVFNRIISLRDTSAARVEETTAAPNRTPSARAATRPKGRSPAEYRAEARARDPQLMAAYERAQNLGLSMSDADLLAGDANTAALFAAASDTKTAAAFAAKWIINELPRALGTTTIDALSTTEFPIHFAAFVRMLEASELSSTHAKLVLAGLVATPSSDPAQLLAEIAQQESDTPDLEQVVANILAANPDKTAAYRGGKLGLLGFFVGQVVKTVGGAIDPADIAVAVRQKLGE